MSYSRLLLAWNQRHIRCEKGLSNKEIEKIEKIYSIKFPNSLKHFFSYHMPVSDGEWGFPNWRDYSEKNINLIRERINAPYRWLMSYITNHNYWLSSWGEQPKTSEDIEKRANELFEIAPTLLPIYSHRYIPVVDGMEDPPIISSVGRDTVYYGRNLEEYLKIEFLNYHVPSFDCVQRIPFWSDIIDANR